MLVHTLRYICIYSSPNAMQLPYDNPIKTLYSANSDQIHANFCTPAPALTTPSAVEDSARATGFQKVQKNSLGESVWNVTHHAGTKPHVRLHSHVYMKEPCPLLQVCASGGFPSLTFTFIFGCEYSLHAGITHNLNIVLWL